MPGLTAARNVWQFADGSDERTMHSRYQLFYHRLYAETLAPEGSFLLCRHGTYGDQVNVSVMWPGDLDATFAQLGDAATSGTSSYVSVGGLPASLTAGLSLGPSGFPFFGADTGGYLHQPPDKEVLTRWFEQTALSTVMQVYADTPPWVANAATGYDAEMLGWYSTYARLHLRLFPYEWTYAQHLASDGRPIARPLGLAHPELGEHPSDTYLFGDSLLVAPVVVRGATSRAVLLPAGNWIDWWTGAVLAGGGTLTAAAPLGTLPLYLQEGSIVPMLRPTIATLRPTTQPATVDSYATTPGVLWARVAPGAASMFTVFDGMVLTQARAAGQVTLTSADGSEFTSGVMFEVVAMGTAARERHRRRRGAGEPGVAGGAGGGGLGVGVHRGHGRDGVGEDGAGAAPGGDWAVGSEGPRGATKRWFQLPRAGLATPRAGLATPRAGLATPRAGLGVKDEARHSSAGTPRRDPGILAGGLERRCEPVP